MAMRSLVVGSLFAAVLMFIIGFVLMGLLGSAAYTPASPQSAAALQAALRDNLTATGTYAVPDPWTAEGEAAWMAGPAAVIRHVASGDSPGVVQSIAGGFVDMFVAALLMGFGLAASGNFRDRARLVVCFALAAGVFMHLGEVAWMGFDWRYSLYVFMSDVLMFIAGGLVLARSLARNEAAATPTAVAAE
jgi:hypothetical protein